MKYSMHSFEGLWIKRIKDKITRVNILEAFVEMFIDINHCKTETLEVVARHKEVTDFRALKDSIYTICEIESLDITCLTPLKEETVDAINRREFYKDAKRNNYRNLAGK